FPPRLRVPAAGLHIGQSHVQRRQSRARGGHRQRARTEPGALGEHPVGHVARRLAQRPQIPRETRQWSGARIQETLVARHPKPPVRELRHIGRDQVPTRGYRPVPPPRSPRYQPGRLTSVTEEARLTRLSPRTAPVPARPRCSALIGERREPAPINIPGSITGCRPGGSSPLSMSASGGWMIGKRFAVKTGAMAVLPDVFTALVSTGPGDRATIIPRPPSSPAGSTQP